MGSLAEIAARLAVLTKATDPLRRVPMGEIADAFTALETKRAAILEERHVDMDNDIRRGSRVTKRRRLFEFACFGAV